jgi:hypothetical protein
MLPPDVSNTPARSCIYSEQVKFAGLRSGATLSRSSSPSGSGSSGAGKLRGGDADAAFLSQSSGPIGQCVPASEALSMVLIVRTPAVVARTGETGNYDSSPDMAKLCLITAVDLQDHS